MTGMIASMMRTTISTLEFAIEDVDVVDACCRKSLGHKSMNPSISAYEPQYWNEPKLVFSVGYAANSG